MGDLDVEENKGFSRTIHSSIKEVISCHSMVFTRLKMKEAGNKLSVKTLVASNFLSRCDEHVFSLKVQMLFIS